METNNIDQLIKDPFTGSSFCYELELNPGIKQWLSMSSGFWSNSLMTKDSQFYNEQLEKLPELHKDLVKEDSTTKLFWIPITINIPEKGMVFANGTNSSDWGWSAVKSILILDGEKDKFKNQTHKMDMTTLINFPQDEFMNGLAFIGVFNSND